MVPAASATVLKNAQPKKLAWFDKIQNAYGRSLEKALKNRFVPLAAAVLGPLVPPLRVFGFEQVQ